MVASTIYPEVDFVLKPLLAEVQAILGTRMVGMYVFGSLAQGDFDRQSDVDVLFATRDVLSPEDIAAIRAMHMRIAEIDSWCATQLEVSYIPLAALRRFDATNNLHPRLDRGKGETLYLMRHDSDWVVQRYLVREKGITLWGPPPPALIDPVSSDDLRQAMRPVLEDWLARIPGAPERIRHRGYQAYIVLTICRVLYTLQRGEVASKLTAANWAREALDKRWISLIDRAWIGRQNPGKKPTQEDLAGTFAFINYALRRFREGSCT